MMRTPVRTHVIVIGNPKGATGKSTIAMHIIAGLLHQGPIVPILSVGSLDLDARQGLLTRYMENRRAQSRSALLVSDHTIIEAEPQLHEAIRRMAGHHDILVLDTPANDTALACVGHAYADTLVMPVNGTLTDLEILARIEPGTLRIQRPSGYAELVWAVRRQRPNLDWIVLRNRRPPHQHEDSPGIERLLHALSCRIGFRTAAGLSERILYRDLFLKGLTLLDLRQPTSRTMDAARTDIQIDLTMSHITARQELRTLLDALELPSFRQRFQGQPPPNSALRGHPPPDRSPEW